MKGKVINKEGRLWIEYLAEGEELDSVDKKEIMIVYTDQHKVMVGETVNFEVASHYTVSDEPLAKIK